MEASTSRRRRTGNSSNASEQGKSGKANKGKVVHFELERETKGAVRFKELGDEPLIRTLYLRKELWQDLDSPDGLKVTITAEELD